MLELDVLFDAVLFPKLTLFLLIWPLKIDIVLLDCPVLLVCPWMRRLARHFSKIPMNYLGLGSSEEAEVEVFFRYLIVRLKCEQWTGPPQMYPGTSARR